MEQESFFLKVKSDFTSTDHLPGMSNVQEMARVKVQR